MRIVGTLMGALVAAVVLIVVAVPVIGGLAGSEEKIWPDEEGTDPIYYRQLNQNDPIQLQYITGTLVNANSFADITTVWSDGETTYTISKTLTDYIDSVLLIGYGDTCSITCKSNGYAPVSLYTTTYNTFATVTDGKITISYDEERESYLKDLYLGSDLWIMCPKDIAQSVGSDVIVIDDIEKAIISPLVRSAESSITTQGRIVIDQNGTVEKSILGITSNTLIGESLDVSVDALDNGLVKISGLTGTVTIHTSSTDRICNATGYTIIAPWQSIAISHELDYAWLLWLLPVMLAVVLIASVAYQIMPKRRNME